MATSTQCYENPPTLNSTCGAGNVEALGGFKTYVTGPADSKHAILLVSDVFGFEAPKLRKLADKVGAAGFLVVVPDFLYGDPFDLTNPQFNREAWIALHTPGKGYEDAKLVIQGLKGRGVSAIGAAGFCWGAVVVSKVAATEDIQAAVLLHPGRITVEEISQVKVPMAILGAEIDQSFPSEQVKQYEEILSTKCKVDSFGKVYPGVAHGWTVRYNEEEEFAVKSAEEAHEDMLNWFIKHVK
ncbi:Dienelactone hydrolase [Dillenia turbinata]|uniref:Dienelactone hydrolase n=1 Tax=Dillenia turbinata TaxID=194707 RepID=A0AAN8VME7_9MAGN